MSENVLLKDLYSKNYIEILANSLDNIEMNPKFDKEVFLKLIFSDDWNNLELKARMKRISRILNLFFFSDFIKASNQILKLVLELKRTGSSENGFLSMFIPDYIETYGIKYYNISVKLFEEVTKFTSCEFAVRSFLIKYPKKMSKQMLVWSQHKHENVRRLSTEGIRPRLPWAMALPVYKNNPAVILPILENLKNDESLFVRKSVANNLNDISKDNPEVVTEIFKRWQRDNNMFTNWIIKHGARTLLKKGDKEVLKMFGYEFKKDMIEFKTFKIENNSNRVSIGDYLSFNFNILTKKDMMLRLEYAIYFQKANKSLSKKVFKISEKKLKGKNDFFFRKKHNFKVISTRKYYTGEHKLAIIINGNEFNKLSFYLKE